MLVKLFSPLSSEVKEYRRNAVARECTSWSILCQLYPGAGRRTACSPLRCMTTVWAVFLVVIVFDAACSDTKEHVCSVLTLWMQVEGLLRCALFVACLWGQIRYRWLSDCVQIFCCTSMGDVHVSVCTKYADCILWERRCGDVNILIYVLDAVLVYATGGSVDFVLYVITCIVNDYFRQTGEGMKR